MQSKTWTNTLFWIIMTFCQPSSMDLESINLKGNRNQKLLGLDRVMLIDNFMKIGMGCFQTRNWGTYILNRSKRAYHLPNSWITDNYQPKAYVQYLVKITSIWICKHASSTFRACQNWTIFSQWRTRHWQHQGTFSILTESFQNEILNTQQYWPKMVQEFSWRKT